MDPQNDPNAPLPVLPGAGAPQPVQPQPSQPVAAVVPQPAPAPQQMYTKEQVEAARQAEAARTHARIAELEARLAQTQSGQAPDPAADQLRQQLLQQSQLLQETNAQVNALIAANQRAEAEKLQAQLQVWTQQRITQYEAAGYGLIREMVGGNTAQEIEASIQRAAVAFQRYAATSLPSLPVPTAVVVQQQPVPNGFPTAPNAPSPVGMDPGQTGFIDAVKQATHPDAVRSGAYAANRQQILQTLREQGGGVSGAFNNAPRYLPAPGQLPPTTWQGVQQPQGLPTPPAVNPQYAAPQPQAPAWPQQPQFAPQQPMPFGVPVQPNQVDQGTPIDVAAARAQAMQVAQQHLANPGAAPTNGVTSSNLASRVPDQGRAGVAPVRLSNTNAQFTGVNPMIRNGHTAGGAN